MYRTGLGLCGVLTALLSFTGSAQETARSHSPWPQQPRSGAGHSPGESREATTSLDTALRYYCNGSTTAVWDTLLRRSGVKRHHPVDHLLAALVYLDHGELARAEAQLRLYNKERQQDRLGASLLAEVLLRQDRARAARSILRPLLRTHPGDPGLLTLAAEAYTAEGRHPCAAALHARIRQSAPTVRDLRHYLAAKLLVAGNTSLRGTPLGLSAGSPGPPQIDVCDMLYRRVPLER